MDERALEHWIFVDDGGALEARLVVDPRAIKGATPRARLVHAGLGAPLVLARTAGRASPPELPFRGHARALVLVLDARAAALAVDVEPFVGLGRFEEFAGATVAAAHAAGVHVVDVGVTAGGLAFRLADAPVSVDALVLVRVAATLLADARGFVVAAARLVEGERTWTLDGGALD